MVSVTSKIDCPSCKSIIYQKIDFPFAFRCSKCNNSFEVFSSEKINDLGIKYNSLNFFSLLKIGDLGRYQNKSFEIIGYVRSVNSYYISNEWMILFSDETKKWLVEVQGSYYIFDNDNKKFITENVKFKKAESKIKFNDKNFVINCISKQIEFLFEGQIELNSVNPTQFFIFDMLSELGDEIATITIFDKENVEINLGKKVNINELNLENINNNNWL
ncbi:MAG: DUF4178 domain-containing protein [Bacteroidota bacterium]